MTRLKSADVEHLSDELAGYHRKLQQDLGLTLGELACSAAGLPAQKASQTGSIRVAAVPITSGEGIISHFSESLAAIAASLGFTAEVTEHCDIAGMAEAYQRQFDIVLASDDDLFCAINLHSGKVVDNSEATARDLSTDLPHLQAALLTNRSWFWVVALSVGPESRPLLSLVAR